MRRPLAACHSLIALLVIGAVSQPARAAMVTDVADAAEDKKPIDINVDLNWHRDSHSATIGREESDGKQLYNASELSYSRVREVLEAKLTVGIYHDLELHFSAPYIISDTQNWGYATVNGASVESMSTVAHNTQNADGVVCTPQGGNATPCFSGNPQAPNANSFGIPAGGQPLFAVPGTVNRAGFGDPTIGITWGIFNEQRDSHLPDTWYPNASRTATWVLGFDYTMPITPIMDPSATTPGNPNAASLPVGEGMHKLDFWTSMSKRFGMIEPYFRLHATVQLAASNAYDNCSIVGKDSDYLIMSRQGQAACTSTTDPFWKGKNVLAPSTIGGLVMGMEFHPIDHGLNGPSLAIAFQFKGDYVSDGRNYSELSDVLHKLTYTSQYFAFNGQLTVDFRFIKYLHWVTYAVVGTQTTHYLTDETVGIARGGDSYVHLGDPTQATLNTANEVNPSYDFRLDAPGHRFLAMSVLDYTISTGLGFNF